MCDFDKDGALNLEEFCIAMHLVVCRVNKMELPDHLPRCLRPYSALPNPDEPFAADLPHGGTLKRTPSSTSSPKPQNWQAQRHASQTSPASSAVSSPGQKPTPVNFEFRPIDDDQDSTIVHPVALRVSPDGQSFAVDTPSKPAASNPNNGEIKLDFNGSFTGNYIEFIFQK